jgi:hypothetical protein
MTRYHLISLAIISALLLSSCGYDYKRMNPDRASGGHSLGNNQHLYIISLDPEKQSALLKFSWLDSVGILTIPPF